MTQPDDFDPNDDPIGALLRRAAHDEAPPPAVRARAVALHAGPVRSVADAAGALLRRIVALAVPDAGGSAFAPAFGVRGGAPASRHHLFHADECEIDLRVSGGDEKWAVSGQLFGAPSASRVVLSRAAAPDAVCELGPTSEFTFAALAPDRYVLTVKCAEVDIVIPELVIGPVGNA